MSDLGSHQLVNVFPYEGAVVRKDLLPQTARWLLRAGDGSAEGGAGDGEAEEPSEGGIPAWHPAWLPATYDLATEVQFFLQDYRAVRPFPKIQAWSDEHRLGAQHCLCTAPASMTGIAPMAYPYTATSRLHCRPAHCDGACCT